jgi:hypothetical protein
MRLTLLIVSIALLGALGCETEDATMVVVDNDYPAVDGGDSAKEITVYKVWWVTSLMPDPVAPGSEGQPARTVPNDDFAYAVLAPGWDPSSSDAPTTFIPAKSAAKLSAARGDTLHVRVSDDTFVGNCLAGKPLSQDDAAFITQRIFPVEFARVDFDAKTCTATLTATDAGADAPADAPAHVPGGAAFDGGPPPDGPAGE